MAVMSRCRSPVPGAGAGFGATAAAALLIYLGFGGFTSTASALTVIHDSGDTTPITPYLAPLQENPGTGAGAAGRSESESEPTAPLPFDVRRLLPIRTAELEPGSLSGRLDGRHGCPDGRRAAFDEDPRGAPERRS